MSKILVTGSTGSLGHEVVRELESNGHDVRAAVRHMDHATEILPDTELVSFDFEFPETFSEALQGIDKVFLICPPANPNMHELVIPFLEKAETLQVKHIVMNSAMAVEYHEETPLRLVEKYLVGIENMEHTILRPNWFMQNFRTFMRKMIKDQSMIYMPAGDARVSFIDVRDVAAVVQAIFAEGNYHGHIHTLTGEEALNFNDVALIFSDGLGRPIGYQALTDEQAEEGFSWMGMSPAAIEYMLGLFKRLRDGENAPVTHDVHDILQRGTIKLKEFISDYADSWS